MGSYENRSARPKKGDGVKVRTYRLVSPLSDKLVFALFTIHRDRAPKSLEDRLLPMRVRQPSETIIRRNVFKKKKPQAPVIYLPDLSDSPFQQRKPLRGKLVAQQLVEEACIRHGITETELRGPGRLQKVADARHEICYLIAANTDMSAIQIGKFLGKDHSTILHSINRFCEMSGYPHPRRKQEDEVVREACEQATA